MWSDTAITGIDLPDKTICLTFDDGPGVGFDESVNACSSTVRLAEYLAGQRVPGTFFVVGKYVDRHPRVIDRVSELGHLVANHTYDHVSLPEFISIGGSAAVQVSKATTQLMGSADASLPIYFRAPYGAWSRDVARQLNQDFLLSLNHIGPIGWDISPNDWRFWVDDISLDTALQQCVECIEDVGRGIVLMHDSNADGLGLARKNMAYMLIEQLIPILKQRGFDFVRLDEIPALAAMSRQPFEFTLQTANSIHEPPLYCCINGHKVDLSDQEADQARWTAVNLGNGRIGLRSLSGYYLSFTETGGTQCVSTQIGDKEAFDVIILGSELIALRTHVGSYLNYSPESGTSVLTANGSRRLNNGEIFRFQNRVSDIG
ncbi:MAG: polysaccharide deacetylase family protein [Gammaproteobacteria bacterium]|nr:polysaccharide deacetylase family protein [Gammaproteobacteria bacterium]